MAKKNLAAMAEKIGANDQVNTKETAVKFISDIPEYHFLIRAIDEKGELEFHTDANGNGKLPTYQEYHFTKIASQRDPKTGKFDPSTQKCFFIVDPEVHGRYFKPIVETLTRLKANPISRLYTEEEYFRKRNPEAYRIAKEKRDLEDEIAKRDSRIEELEKKLGFRKQ